MLTHGLADEAELPQEVDLQNVDLGLNAIPIPVHARNAKRCLKRMNSLHYRMANKNPKPRGRAPQSSLPNPIGEKVNEELE